MVGAMDPLPSSGCCTCGRAIWFVRATEIDRWGHFECRVCRKSYRPSMSPVDSAATPHS